MSEQHMSRTLKVAAAQSGPVPRDQGRSEVVDRLIAQMRDAHAQGCDLVVFTECALTAFFPHWWIDDENELDSWFEREMPGPVTQPLFDEAARLGIGFHLGYAELDFEQGRKRRFNSCILVGKDGRIIGHHRKIHLPGHEDHRPYNPFQNLEQRYFDVGDRGFQTWNAFGGVVGMCICNDRRWPETYRVLALNGAELIVLGYNTPTHIPEYPELDRLVEFQHHLCMQAGACQNGCWIVAVAKGGHEEGVEQIGHSCIISPNGEIVAKSETTQDELIVCDCDFDLARRCRERFNFAVNRSIEQYAPITQRRDAVPPADGGQ